MNKKKTIIIILIAIVLVVAGVCLYLFCFKNDSLNNAKLEEDKKSIVERTTIVNAKKSSKSTGAKEVYEGEGYTIEVYHGGEIVNYVILVDGKEVWTYDKLYPETSR